MTSFRRKLVIPFVVVYLALAPLIISDTLALWGYAGSLVAVFTINLLHGVFMRLGLIVGNILWFVYGYFVLSYGTMIQATFLTIMLGVTIIRMARSQKAEEKVLTNA